MVDFGWHKFTEYRHGPGFFSANINLLVNLDRWNGLADSQRACLNRMTDWLNTEWPKWRAAESERQAKLLADAGVEYVDLGDEWAAKAEALYWEELETASPELIGKIRPLLQ